MRLTQHLALVFLAVASAWIAQAETGAEGWLRYAPLTNTAAASYGSLPSQIVILGNTPTDQAVANELQRGLTAMLGRPFTIAHETEDNTNAIILTNLATLNKVFALTGDKLPPESFTLDPRTLSQVDNKGVRAVTPGSYRIAVGGGQPSETTNTQTATFNIEGTQELPR